MTMVMTVVPRAASKPKARATGVPHSKATLQIPAQVVGAGNTMNLAVEHHFSIDGGAFVKGDTHR